MSYNFKKKYLNSKYPHLKLYTNMLLDDVQLLKFINKNKLVTLSNNKKKIIIQINNLLKINLDKKINQNIYNIINQNLSSEKTLLYLFHNVLSGIYVKIINNKIKIFYLFYNENYRNDWLSNVIITNKIKNRLGYNFINNNKLWSVNNCIINNRNFKNKNTDNLEFNRLLEFKYLLKLVCKKHKIKDCEFIINRRDFPVLRYDGKHPYTHVYNNITKYNNDKFIPIFSQVTSPEYADIPIINVDDIALLTKISYPPTNKVSNLPNLVKWQNKKNIAFFRGTATGCGVTEKTNQRIKLAKISYELNNKKILDAGLTSWNYRDKIYNKKITIIKPKKLGFPLVNTVTPNEQAYYKYIIHIDGHVSAYRLTRELYSGSLLLIVKSPKNYSMWFTPLLKEYVHYIPIKEDLSDLIQKIKWCKENDDKCKKIALASYDLAINELTINKALDYMAYALNNLK